MPFLDHLEELRWRILYSLLAIVVATLIGWVIVERVDVVGLLIRPIAPLLPGGKLKFTSPTEPFFITLKFAFALGLLLASPVVAYQAWAFLAPALYERERRLVIPALAVGIVLFLGGATAAYLWVLPRALQVLFSFQRGVLEPIITAGNYFGFAAQIIIAFGLITELPLVVVILATLGVVTPQFLARNRRYAIVLSAVAAALLSPPDAISMLVMMIPLWLLYEVGIWCAWIVTKRRARRDRATAGAAVLLLLAVTAGGPLKAQQQPQVRRDTTGVQGRALDTATARRMGLPTGPTRSFPARDAVMDSLLQLPGFRVTQYVADTLIVAGDSQAIFLHGNAFVDRLGSKLEADVVRYREASCRLDAEGDPRLFEEGGVMVGEAMRYDTCIRRGTVHRGFTDFNQGGVTWYIRGDVAVDSGSTRMFAASSDITSDDRPVPDYHFSTGELKWLNKNVMVARPAVLYVRDVPILWLPFIFQDIRSGRRSGMLVPRFGVNDIVRPTRSYERHFANLGYFVAVNNYFDLMASLDWYANRNVTIHGQSRYRWLSRFVNGSFTYGHVEQLDVPGSSTQISWQHQQAFDQQTHFNASVNYATSGTVLQQNSVDPALATASLASQVNFDKRFSWGTFNLGGSRSQDLSSGQVSQNVPRLTLTPAPVNITSNITWSPGFSFTNQQTFHGTPGTKLPIPGGASLPDTLFLYPDSRQSEVTVQTPVRVGRWNWSNSLNVTDQVSNALQEVDIVDSTVPGGRRRVFYSSTFATALDWQTGINLPQLFSGSWKLQPGVQIINTTSAGPFLLRNQYSNGEIVQQGKRVQVSLGMRPTLFAFFPGLGPLERIRHSISPIVDYFYAPGAQVPAAYAHAIDPQGLLINSRSDPQQTISIGLSQNFEAKLRAAASDSGKQPPRKFRLLSLNTDPIAYNFEQAKQPGHTGWQTQTIGNTFASDLLSNFSLRLVHNLWDGPVGFSSSKFSPFLQNVNASFSITPGTLRGVARLLGFHPGGKPPTTVSTTPSRDTSVAGQTGRIPPLFGGPRITPLGAYGGGQGFSMTVSYTSTRTRPQPAGPPTGGVIPVVPSADQQQLSTTLNFQPSPKWRATWSTQYDLISQQFSEHIVRLERDLNRWHATFGFVKSPNGNFAFAFSVALLDAPDIKFDYEQQTITQ
jgi:Tat protein translocase TatC